MDYKNEIKKMIKRRDEYFPLFDYLLGIYNNRGEYDFPLRIDGAARIALTLELIDIGYLDTESFIIKKNRGVIEALYFKGEYPLTEKGIIAHRSRLHRVRGKYIKLAVILSLFFLATVIYFLIF